MNHRIDLSGTWELVLDETCALGVSEVFGNAACDEMRLPDSTSHAGKGGWNPVDEIECLTDRRKFEGHAWFRRTLAVSFRENHSYRIFLERTRRTVMHANGREIGREESLCTPHVFEIPEAVAAEVRESGRLTLTILVANVGYRMPGGHMTSPDTQTNWNGILGRMEIQEFPALHLDDIRVDGCVESRSFLVTGRVCGGAEKGTSRLKVRAGRRALGAASDSVVGGIETEYPLADILGEDGRFSIRLNPGPDAALWSEHHPELYRIVLTLGSDEHATVTGLRHFGADGMRFSLNGEPVHLRGKHDGMVFPLTGYAPMDVDSWRRVLAIAKEYGINHYRFHTCCPPEAAFQAADEMGIFMQPELHAWCTLAAPGEEGFDEGAQEYLVREGLRIQKAFGHHPSFCMMSLGNELWGNPARIDQILGILKAADRRHLFVQGSNNFQFSPVILENEDFFSGVRFDRDRLIRGSYAMCDAPQGHIQTLPPSTRHRYDEAILPTAGDASMEGAVMGEVVTGDARKERSPETTPEAHVETVEIQIGTGVATVSTAAGSGPLRPKIPVVSHEIGQYCFFPDFDEIDRYTGVLEARNLRVFQRRLQEAGLVDRAGRYFAAAGQFAVDCYKAEVETALRSGLLAGFQLLDLQDFPGQGTALVGVLNAFMESKGLVSAEKWREFCSETVLLAEFDSHVHASGERVRADVRLYHYGAGPIDGATWNVRMKRAGETVWEEHGLLPHADRGLSEVCGLTLRMPDLTEPGAVDLHLMLIVDGVTLAHNEYRFWIYPDIATPLTDALFPARSLSEDAVGIRARTLEWNGRRLHIASSLEQALPLLAEGACVLLLPEAQSADPSALPGTYCTDFWCYPMFRRISESMGKPVPVGTLGLCIDTAHPALAGFPCEAHTTPQWHRLVTHSFCERLDNPLEVPLEAHERDIVSVIDNFERNQRLAILRETRRYGGNLLVCTVRLDAVVARPEARAFSESILAYAMSDAFQAMRMADKESGI